jgi:sulfite reductase (ferredoxin)
VVSAVQFGFRDAESAAFEAQLLHEAGQYRQADEKAYQAMLLAARTLVRIEFPDVPTDAPTVVEEFRRRFVDTKLFWDKYAQGKFAQYLFSRHESPDTRYTADSAHRTAEEAALFIDAAHACHARILAAGPQVQLKL